MKFKTALANSVLQSQFKITLGSTNIRQKQSKFNAKWKKKNNVLSEGTLNSNWAADKVLIISERRMFSFFGIPLVNSPHYEKRKYWKTPAIHM
jgi:hypothetical protein